MHGLSNERNRGQKGRRRSLNLLNFSEPQAANNHTACYHHFEGELNGQGDVTRLVPANGTSSSI